MRGLTKKKALVILLIITILAAVSFSVWWFVLKKDTVPQQAKEQQQVEEATESNTDILTHLADSPTLSTFLGAIQKTSLAGTLPSTGSFTVFAPTNEAFDALSDEVSVALTDPSKLASLTAVVSYHIVPGYFKKADLTDGKLLKTLTGQEILVKVIDGDTYVVDAKGFEYKIEKSDRLNTNGVVHVLSGVMLPQ